MLSCKMIFEKSLTWFVISHHFHCVFDSNSMYRFNNLSLIHKSSIIWVCLYLLCLFQYIFLVKPLFGKIFIIFFLPTLITHHFLLIFMLVPPYIKWVSGHRCTNSNWITLLCCCKEYIFDWQKSFITKILMIFFSLWFCSCLHIILYWFNLEGICNKKNSSTKMVTVLKTKL